MKIVKCTIIFRDAIDLAVKYKDNPTDIEDQILEELDNFHLETKPTNDGSLVAT
jgi:hypothetical protein